MRRPPVTVEIEGKPGSGRVGLLALVRHAAERAAWAHRRGDGPAQGVYRRVQRDVMALAVRIAAGGREVGDVGLGAPAVRVTRACMGAVGRALDAARNSGGVSTALGAMYESLLALHPTFTREAKLVLGATRIHARKTSGSYYTPAPLVEHLLDTALDPVLAATGADGALNVRVCDPACGCGNFLVAAAHRIARATGVAQGMGGRRMLSRVVRSCIFGLDIDPLAAAICRASLRLEAGDWDTRTSAPDDPIRCADALFADWRALFPRAFAPGGGFDVVVGNPPYLSQLARETTASRRGAAALRRRFPGAVGAYTDPASLFLLVATEIARPGGRIALVLPQSVLATRDAAGVRGLVLERGGIESLWMARERMFDAGVMVCAPTIRIGVEPTSRIRRWVGPTFRRIAAARARPDQLRDSWARLGADGVPEPGLRTAGALADIATATADFRDQYYGLRGCVVEDADLDDPDPDRFPPLITTGLIDPACCRWGRRPLRFDRRAWTAPRVDLDRLDPLLRPWARARMVPKVLLATQTRVLEAAVDGRGRWLPCVPVITVVPREPSRLWHIAATLLSPVATAWAIRRHGGAGLSADAIKLSAHQVLALPMPRPGRDWNAAAALIRRASATHADASRGRILTSAAAAMGRAYGLSEGAAAELLTWWRARTGPRGMPVSCD